MKLLQRPPAAAIAVLVSAMIAVGMVSAPCAQAQTRITVPGAGPLYYPNIVAQLPLGGSTSWGQAKQPGRRCRFWRGTTS